MSDPFKMTVEVYDYLTRPQEGLEPGFYYNIPHTAEEEAVPGEIFLAGPYPDRAAALQAAQDFIRSALEEQVAEAFSGEAA